MIDISVANLSKSFEVGSQILNKFTFQVDAGQRVGLLGKNGCGKTTLLRILTGAMDYDEGEIVIAPDKRVGLISQIPIFPVGFTVEQVLDTAFVPLQKLEQEMTALAEKMADGDHSDITLKRYDTITFSFENGGGYETTTNKNKVCSGLSVAQTMREQLFDNLSGGEKTRVNLARLILEDTDILLLDEPTNHLDLKATEWLEEYLQSFKGSVLTVSHDRYFLDKVVNRVIEIVDGKAESYTGNYSFFAVEKEVRYEAKMRQFEKEQAEFSRLQATARSMHEHGTEILHKRAFSIEKRMEKIQLTDRPTGKSRALNIRFGERDFRGDEVMTIKGLEKSFGARILFSDINLEVGGNERIALIGDNGTGKSTMLKIILNEEQADAGKLRMGPTVKLGYLPQIVHFSHPERSLVDTLIYDLDCSAQSARNRLGSFNFKGEDVFKPVSALSGGEQSRLRLCMLMDEKINLLVLDEPTNHLDIQSREWIESAVEDYEGNLLFVSHDRYFIERFATRIWCLEGGQVTDFKGSYDEFQNARAKNQFMPPVVEVPVADKSVKKEKPKRTGGTKTIEKELAVTERAIAKVEERMEQLAIDMQTYSADYVKLQTIYEDKEKAEEETMLLYEKWEELSAALEEAR